MACECIRLTYREQGGEDQIFQLDPMGTYNGKTYFKFNDGTGDRYLYFDSATNQWGLDTILGYTVPRLGVLDSEAECPVGDFTLTTPKIELFETAECPEFICPCIRITYKYVGQNPITVESYSLGILFGFDYYSYYDENLEQNVFIYYYDNQWYLLTGDSIEELETLGTLVVRGDCPNGEVDLLVEDIEYITIEPCEGCDKIEDRTKREVKSIKLPKIYDEDDRGYFKCCCPFMVLASNTTDSWKNDVSSAWIKLSDPADTAVAELYKNGSLATYQPVAVPFVKESNAFYWTIQWKDVLANDGIGCYSLKITYDIAGLQQTFTWSIYNLKPYSVQNALKTARLRVIFDSYQEIEGIDFTDSQVEDSIRFYGYIGSRQPNMETDNLIYKNREMKKVIRENLNTYEIHVDPTCIEHIDKLTDLYLLSENELFLSDYNAHNPSYKYQDVPAIVEESPEIEYFDFSREVGLTCKVGDKFKDKRSYYK